MRQESDCNLEIFISRTKQTQKVPSSPTSPCKFVFALRRIWFHYIHLNQKKKSQSLRLPPNKGSERIKGVKHIYKKGIRSHTILSVINLIYTEDLK